MAITVPVPLNPSQALITPGFPLVAVEKSNPVASMALNTTPAPSAAVSTEAVKVAKAVITVHPNDRVI